MGMKTREEIEKGLECCHTMEVSRCVCEKCPYSANGHQTAICDDLLAEDAIALLCQCEMDAKIADIKRDVAFAKCEQLNALVPKWISVAERLPKGEALAVNDCGTMMVGWIEYCTYGQESMYVCNDPDSGIGISYITHWMPLPEPPKEEGE